MKEIILASASERRSAILNDCGIAHTVVISGQDEKEAECGNIARTVEFNAVAKARKVASSYPGALIISADTLVSHHGEPIGKPGGEKQARKILRRFSGSTVEVLTGTCVIDAETTGMVSTVDVSKVHVAVIPEGRMEKIFRHLGPYDKAGGFSIEGVGALLFDNIEGSFFNILGLSLISLKDLFYRLGYDIMDYVHA
jgi:septum formation protein